MAWITYLQIELRPTVFHAFRDCAFAVRRGLMTNTLSRYTILDISIKGHLETVHCVSLALLALSVLEFLGFDR